MWILDIRISIGISIYVQFYHIKFQRETFKIVALRAKYPENPDVDIRISE